jgi:hypothetical protein
MSCHDGFILLGNIYGFDLVIVFIDGLIIERIKRNQKKRSSF